MGYIAIDILCPKCEHCWDDLVDREVQNGKFDCPECGSPDAEKTISRPNVTRASYVDGNNRFRDLKEAARLKSIKASSGSTETRKEISREISKLKVKQYE